MYFFICTQNSTQINKNLKAYLKDPNMLGNLE